MTSLRALFGVMLLAGTAGCATTDRPSEEAQVLRSCERVSWQLEEVATVRANGSQASERIRFFNLESFESCLQTFGYVARELAPGLVLQALQERACRGNASMASVDEVSPGDVAPRLDSSAYRSCLSAPDVAAGPAPR